jgi:hypothetical protein
MTWLRSTRGARLPQRRAGNAGLIATVVVALAGVLVGALSAYMTERGAVAEALSTGASPTSTAAPESPRRVARDRIVERLIAGEAPPERLAPPPSRMGAAPASRPKIVIILDDMGIDRRLSEHAIALPGPLTYSFLPYGRNAPELAETVRLSGGEVMLHLPMEPAGNEDPGPHALKSDMTGAEFIRSLEWNLDRFDGYAGVNNHMGSKLTADIAAMKTLIGYLNHRDLFFVDSVTTSQTTVRRAGRELGLEVFARDVFLDAEAGSESAVRAQLALAERIARETGYVVAIGHPREETLKVLGPWLTTAPARGFDLVVASTLRRIGDEEKPQAVAAAAPPTLRF